ncbi:MAG: glycerol-3-phosphate dehydrogenase/oxidase [Acidobacteriota bacterium]
MSRLAELQGQSFDVIVAGGGIVGCGVARDAARRGLTVALFEQHDFGSGTTAASSRIIHGGLRYLETADFGLVRMDMRERETLLRIAPHLVQPLEFTIPFGTAGAWQRVRLGIGLTLYDALAWDSSLPRRRLRRADATYYDARIDSPERLTLENVMDAAAHGARAFNYAEVTAPLTAGGALAGVRVRDRLSGDEADVRARVVVNAAGPWLDRLAGRLTAPTGRVRTTKGVHLVCGPLTDRPLVLFSGVDGRLMFAIPRGGLTWLGTTDTDYDGDPADAVATRDDVEYVLRSLQRAFPGLRVADVLFTTAGVRALVRRPGHPSAVSRAHRIDDRTMPGLVAIVGGKITGYRAIAEDATDAVCRVLGIDRRSNTADEPLPGAREFRPGTSAPHLEAIYGSRAAEVLALAASDSALARPLAAAYPDIGAQVVHAVRHEHCRTIADFLRRRSLLGMTADQGWGAVEAVAGLMGAALGWTAEQRAHETDVYRRDIARTESFRARS